MKTCVVAGLAATMRGPLVCVSVGGEYQYIAIAMLFIAVKITVRKP